MTSPDYKIYKLYKGEQDNPFDNVQQNTQYQYWEYESMFEHKFTTGAIKGDKEVSFKEFLEHLFMRLSDRYDAMDNGKNFKDLYNNTQI